MKTLPKNIPKPVQPLKPHPPKKILNPSSPNPRPEEIE
jgi:hypothetical protein